MPKFSLVIPTYTGEEYIGAVLESVSKQDLSKLIEVVVVIDGPNEKIKKTVEIKKTKYDGKIKIKIIQFVNNKGRFTARFDGAKAAISDYVLFADDRNILGDQYFKYIQATDEEIVIPNVIQSPSKSIINKCLYLIRKKIYRNWGEDFKSYHINKENFEKSSKGTTGLWINRQKFISACEKIMHEHKSENTKTLNEDTKLFKLLLEEGEYIFRMSEAKVYYQSRSGLTSELLHIYERGPRFLDYYSNPHTRFFYPLMLFYISIPIVLVGCVLSPKFFAANLLVLVITNLLFAIYISKSIYDVYVVTIAFPLISVSFAAGLIKGIFLKSLNAIT